MKIAVLSDIHDNIWKLRLALDATGECDAMVCCGDLCSPFIVDQLARGFRGPIHVVFGNNDGDTYRVTQRAMGYPNVRLRGEFFTDEFAGLKIAVNHFDSIALEIARSGLYDAVFFGHTHVVDIRLLGRTLAVNPGSIMGVQFDANRNQIEVLPTFAIYDTGTKEARVYEIAQSSEVQLVRPKQ